MLLQLILGIGTFSHGRHGTRNFRCGLGSHGWLWPVSPSGLPGESVQCPVLLVKAGYPEISSSWWLSAAALLPVRSRFRPRPWLSLPTLKCRSLMILRWRSGHSIWKHRSSMHLQPPQLILIFITLISFHLTISALSHMPFLLGCILENSLLDRASLDLGYHFVLLIGVRRELLSKIKIVKVQAVVRLLWLSLLAYVWESVGQILVLLLVGTSVSIVQRLCCVLEPGHVLFVILEWWLLEQIIIRRLLCRLVPVLLCLSLHRSLIDFVIMIII